MGNKNDYKQFFGLQEEPFNTVASPRFFFLSPIHSIALNKSVYTVDTRKGVSIVWGDIGTGKSTLARIMHDDFLNKGYVSVLLTNPGYASRNALIRTINEGFGISTAKSYKDNLDRLKGFLLKEAETNNKTVVLILDEAQELNLPLLETLRQILNFESEKKLLQLVLFPQEEFRTKLQDYRTRNFRRRVAYASTLDRMDLNVMSQMIEFRWTVATGNKGKHPFTQEALQKIFEHSAGLPSEACIIADNSLLVAFLNQSQQVTPELVEGAVEDRLKNVGKLDKEPKTTSKNKSNNNNITLEEQAEKEKGVVYEQH
jgi:type II secretory pathway predicted ATPase ExeA